MKIFLQGVKKKLTINKVYNQTLYKLIIDIKRELQPYVSAEIVIKHMMMLDKRERKKNSLKLKNLFKYVDADIMEQRVLRSLIESKIKKKMNFSFSKSYY